MRAEFIRDHSNNEVTQLEREHEQLTHSLMRSRRDEQFEMEKLKREFTARNTNMEARQEAIEREVLGKKKELERVEQRIREEQGTQESVKDKQDAARRDHLKR